MKNFSYKIEDWKSEDASYLSYWNDGDSPALFNQIKAGNFSELEKTIKAHGFIEDFNSCVKYIESKNKSVSGHGADLASGTMWLTAHIMNAYEKKLKSFCSVDYSEHCLINVGQEVLKHYKVNCEKLSLCVGSFYDIKRPDASLDFIVMSQAFHHADDPNKLLKEMRRVLKPGGFIIMIGELFIPKPLYLKCYANYVVSRICSSKFFPKIFKKIKLLDRLGSKKFKGDFQDIYFPPDPNLGDHYYLESQYRRFFRENNFMFKRVPASLVNHLSYVLFKKCKKVH